MFRCVCFALVRVVLVYLRAGFYCVGLFVRLFVVVWLLLFMSFVSVGFGSACWLFWSFGFVFVSCAVSFHLVGLCVHKCLFAVCCLVVS